MEFFPFPAAAAKGRREAEEGQGEEKKKERRRRSHCSQGRHPLEFFITPAPPIDDINVAALPAQHRLITAAPRHGIALLPQSDPVGHGPSSTSLPLSRSNPRAHLPPCVQEPIVLS